MATEISDEMRLPRIRRVVHFQIDTKAEERWDETIVEGDLPHRDALVRFRRAGSDLAAATVERDEQSLCAELAMESDFRRPS